MSKCHRVFIIYHILIFIKMHNGQQDQQNVSINNVCPAFRDYLNMKNNDNCWYNYAADQKVVSFVKKKIFFFEIFFTAGHNSKNWVPFHAVQSPNPRWLHFDNFSYTECPK